MSSTNYRLRRRNAGLCPDCGAADGWCRPCRDKANARHKRWRDDNHDHFRAAQAKQRARRRKLRALAASGRVSVESRVIEGHRVLIAVVPPRRSRR